MEEPRIGETMFEPVVVRQEQEPFGVRVEPPGGIDIAGKRAEVRQT
jgi:hypothetical protein